MAYLGNTIVAGTLRVLNDVNANKVSGDGSGLTTLNASNISSGTLDAARLPTSGASAGSYGPSAAVTGSNNTTMNVPYITVDAHGRVTSISNKVYTSKDTVYTHPTSAGNIHLPAAGASGNFLKWSSAGTGKWESLTKSEVTTALGYTPPTTNTTYSAGTGISLSGTTFSNSGVRSIATGSANGTISVNTNGTAADVAVKGLASGAYAAAYSHPSDGANTGSFGPSANASPAHGGKFNVPYVTINAQGHVTAASTKTITLPAQYVHPTGAGNNHIPSGGSSGQFLKWSSSGVAVWAADNNTLNTAGSTNSISKLFLVGAASQAANPQTYSHSNVYETNGVLTASSFTGNLNGDNYIQWGGPSIAAAVSPTDAGCIDDFGHNKAAFWNGLIDVEYTTDGGSSWINYGLTDDQKWALVTVGGYSVVAGKGTATANNGGSLTNSNVTNYRARITLHTRDANKNGKFYTAMRKLLLNVSTNGAGGSTVKVTGRTIGNYNNNADTWNDLGSFSVSGWSGWNSIPMNITFGGESTQTDQYADLRLEFWATSVSTSSTSTLTVLDIRIIGVTNWAVDSFAATGHMYTYDRSKNVTFPAKVTATSFSGALTGNVSGNCSGTATAANKLNTNAGSATQPVYFSNGVPVATTYALNATVPSGAKFTDTTYTGSNGILLSGTTFSNSGVRSIATGSANGTISVNTNGTTADVAVKGLGTAAYTASTAYAAASHGNHVPTTQTANNAVFLRNDNTWQTVTPANIGAAASSHTHTTIVTTGDHRNDATTPASYSNNLIFQGLKTNSKIGSPSSDNYSYLVGLKGWTDSSGGLGHELAFNNSGIMHRIGTSDSAWGAWESLLTSNSTLNAAKLSGLTKAQVTTALGYTPPTTNTTYSANNGVGLSGTTFYNSGVRSIATGSSNGTISVNTNGTAADVAVKGLGTAAYTASTAYAASSHTHNYAGSSSAGGVATSAAKLETVSCIDGVAFNGTADIAHFGTCSTAAATAAKVVDCAGFALKTGARIIVKFTVTNTAASPILNVNATGAKAIQYRGAAITAGYLAANRTYEFVYDGTNYQLVGDIDTNTTYSAGTAALIEAGTDTTNRVWSAKILAECASGIKTITTGSTNGTISVEGTDIPVKGLGSAAYTASTAYAAAGHNHSGTYTPYAASVGSNQKFIYTNSSGVLTAANFEIWITD